MKSKKTLKRALLSSVLALVLCFTMLIGTTYAWFTDSVTSSGNIIKSGTLNIDLGIKTAADEAYVSVKQNAEKKAFNYDKWEPGYTEWVNAKVYTTGNLALKYTMTIKASGTVSALAEVIDVYYKPAEVEIDPTDRAGSLAQLTKIGTLKDALDGTIVINDTLIPGEANATTGVTDEDFATLALHMQETAGNEYQHLSIGTSFSLQILATQYTYEADSFDDQYDALAEYPVQAVEVTDAAGLMEALTASDKDIQLVAGTDYGLIQLGSTSEVKDITIIGAENADFRLEVLNGATLENVTIKDVDTQNDTSTGGWVDKGAIVIRAGSTVKNLVIEDTTIESTNGAVGIGVQEPTAEITLKNTDIIGTKYAVYGSGPIAKLDIEDCEFNNINSWAILLNGTDTVGMKLTINNCSFVNCTGGIAKTLGSSQPEGAATVFTNNTLDGACRGHDGSDAKWFAIPGASSTVTVSGNVKDGVEWTPGTAQGLGK